MERLAKRWSVKPTIDPDAEKGLRDYHPVLRQLLYNRNYRDPDSARRYLDAIPPDGCDPHKLQGMDAAIHRLQRALQAHERIAVYGDYDVDGVTATALLTTVLEDLDGNVMEYIPNRFEEGYGLNCDALDTLHSMGVTLVVTVDCGVRSVREVEHAQRLGIDIIVSDHHHPADKLPPAWAIINPKQTGDTYPEKNLAGVGLAYKIAQAIADAQGYDRETADQHLDLVALGTVADLAPLVGENRHLVRLGLQRLRYPRKQGILSLMGVSGISPEKINATDIGFRLGPRLNAAGRLDSALEALRLLRTKDILEAGSLAQKLNDQNSERQQITRKMQEQSAVIAFEEDPDALLLFAAHPDFNSGVVGLAASRLVEQFYRPAIVAHVGEEFTRASCRSIPGFHITEALDECAELLERHGGHKAAAGFTVRNDNLPVFLEHLRKVAGKMMEGVELSPTLTADMEIPLSELKPDILPLLGKLQPTGQENPEAVFVSRDLFVKRSRMVGREGAHLKMSISDGFITYDAIAFGQGHWQEKMPPRIDLMYTYEVNEFNGRVNLQLNIIDMKAAGEPD